MLSPHPPTHACAQGIVGVAAAPMSGALAAASKVTEGIDNTYSRVASTVGMAQGRVPQTTLVPSHASQGLC